MAIRFHPHALERMAERGATKRNVTATVKKGEQFEAKFSRFGFRRDFVFDKRWRGKYYKVKQIDAYVVRLGNDWLVVSVVTRYF